MSKKQTGTETTLETIIKNGVIKKNRSKTTYYDDGSALEEKEFKIIGSNKTDLTIVTRDIQANFEPAEPQIKRFSKETEKSEYKIDEDLSLEGVSKLVKDLKPTKEKIEQTETRFGYRIEKIFQTYDLSDGTKLEKEIVKTMSPDDLIEGFEDKVEYSIKYRYEDKEHNKIKESHKRTEIINKSNDKTQSANFIDDAIKTAKVLGIKNFPSKEDLKSEKKDLTTLIVENFLTQKGIKADFLPKENSKYTKDILTQFSNNTGDSKLKDKALNQLADIQSECLEKQKNVSLKSSIPQPKEEQKASLSANLESSVPQHNKDGGEPQLGSKSKEERRRERRERRGENKERESTTERQYTQNGADVKEKTTDFKNEDGSRTVTQKVDFNKIGNDGNAKGSATASVTIGPDGAIKKELTKKTEATSTVSSSGPDGSSSSTKTSRRSTTTRFSSSSGDIPGR